MKTILACLLVLAINVSLSNASCFLQPLESEKSDGCYDSKGKLHEFDSSWRTDNCLDCSCSKAGIRCCTSFVRPVGYDNKKCISMFNKKTCTYKVVEKEDHSKECPVRGWVG